MEEETKKMETKMEALRRVIEAGEADRNGGNVSGSRWRSGANNKPLTKGYVKEVLDAPSKTRKGGVGERKTSSSNTFRAAPSQDRAGSGGGDSGATSPSSEKVANPIGDLTSAGLHEPRTEATRAAANLQAAMLQQSEETMAVEAFLAKLKLDRYTSLFLEQGFDCMEVVLEMEESHMRDLGMAAGHILKLKKHLAELQGPAAAQTVAASAPTAAIEQRGDPSTTQRRVSFGGTEAHSVPRAEAAGVGCGGDSLWDGPGFDEKESAASFQEALMAWRNGGKTEPDAATLTNSNKAATAKPTATPGSFWSSMGGGEIDIPRATTPLGKMPKELCAPPAVAIQAEPPSQSPSRSEDKICCYHCYKQFYARFAVERRDPTAPDEAMRRLCSEACGDRWVAAMQARAEALQKRRDQIEKMQEMQRALMIEEPAVAQDGRLAQAVAA